MDIFKSAEPIFLQGYEEKPNTLACFRKDFLHKKGERAELIIAAHCFYRVYVNGEMAAVGPAPAPFGFLRADRWDITRFLAGDNKLAIEVMGYVPVENNISSFETSCLIAEIRDGEETAAATDASWPGGILKQKQCNTETLSFGRRIPLESYRLDREYEAWRTGKIADPIPCARTNRTPGILERETALPDIGIRDCFCLTAVTSMEPGEYSGAVRSWWESDDYIARCGGENLERTGMECASLHSAAYDGKFAERYCQNGRREYTLSGYARPAALEFAFAESEIAFIGIAFSSKEPVTVDITWNDYLDESGEIPVKADSSNRVIRLRTQGGGYSFEAFEPHYVKYVKVVVYGGGEFVLQDLYLRAYRFPDLDSACFLCDDMELNRIYHAAKRTLITNTLGFFLDSPERERGGWAGDSYWTGRAAAMLMSDTTVERVMLMSFLRAESTEMMEYSFPCCCCGGQEHESIIMYTWNLFVLLELADYYERTADGAIKTAFRERVEGFIKASQEYKNSAGLLENLPGSVFIDWSSANSGENTAPVSVPANTLYALVLKRLGRMYENAAFQRESEAMFGTVRAFYAEQGAKRNDLFTMYPFLSDALLCEEGTLKEKGVYSEAAQYYYFWSGLLERKSAPELLKLLLSQFGPCPEDYRGTAHLNIGNCGVFFGHMMRFEVLSQAGEFSRLRQEMKRLCGYMADQDPSTFWETMSGTDSRNHGFGSHFGVVLVRDFLGIQMPDAVNKTLTVAPHPAGLHRAKGGFTGKDGRIEAAWFLKDSLFEMRILAPEGYTVTAVVPKEFRYAHEIVKNGETFPMNEAVTFMGNSVIRITL